MGKSKKIVAAAIQLDTEIGATDKNLANCLRLAEQAVNQGASWIALPEFFNTGVTGDARLVRAIEPENGKSAQFLQSFSKQHSVVIGGSFMCRVLNQGVRNRYLCFSNGELIGKHDKDLPTMMENAFYEGANDGDTGYLGEVDGVKVGSALCWEFMRTQTAKRLQGKIDVVMGGSHWWSLPENFPAWITKKSEERNASNVVRSVQETARLIGAPVIHGSHCNKIQWKMFGLPFLYYKGVLEGFASIVDAEGNILAQMSKEDGEGFVISEVDLNSVPSNRKIPRRFWLLDRTALATLSWHLDGIMGRRWYRKNVR